MTPQSRRKNRIRTIHASLAIENNTLALEQVTAVIDGKQLVHIPAHRRLACRFSQLSVPELLFSPFFLCGLCLLLPFVNVVDVDAMALASKL